MQLTFLILPGQDKERRAFFTLAQRPKSTNTWWCIYIQTGVTTLYHLTLSPVKREVNIYDFLRLPRTSHQGYLGFKWFILCLSSPDLPTVFYILRRQMSFFSPAEARGGVSLYSDYMFEPRCRLQQWFQGKTKMLFLLRQIIGQSKVCGKLKKKVMKSNSWERLALKKILKNEFNHL